MLTKKDKADLVQEFSKIFATKEELAHVTTELRRELKNDILQFKDDILFEIKAMREELAIVIGYRQTIENHEERISMLEQPNSRNQNRL